MWHILIGQWYIPLWYTSAIPTRGGVSLGPWSMLLLNT